MIEQIYPEAPGTAEFALLLQWITINREVEELYQAGVLRKTCDVLDS